jgi:hypothetical protein
MRNRTSLRWGYGLLALVLVASCGSTEEGGSSRTETSTLTDAAGHSCEARRAAGEEPVLTCDGAPDLAGESCQYETTACFRLLDLDAVVHLCAACCNPPGSRASIPSVNAAGCSAVACSSKEECPFGEGACVDGRCIPPTVAAPPPVGARSGLGAGDRLAALADGPVMTLCQWYVARIGGYEGFFGCDLDPLVPSWNDFECEGGPVADWRATVADVEACAKDLAEGLSACTLDGTPGSCARVEELCPNGAAVF